MGFPKSTLFSGRQVAEINRITGRLVSPNPATADGAFASLGELEAAHPAAAHAGRRAHVGVVEYVSDGATWVSSRSPVSGGSALPTTTAWSTTWDTAGYHDMGSYTVTGALALVSSDTSSVRGGCTQAVLIANGSNVPTLDGVAATAYGYMNTNGSRNLVQLYRAGDAKFWSCGAYTGAALSIPTAPSWPSAPTIGAAVVGSAASVTGAATGTAPITYSYQWTLDGAAISGATASSYTAVAGDATHALRCVVTATNAHGSADGTSNAVTVSAAATVPDAPTGLTLGTATSTTQPLTWSAPDPDV